MSRCGGTIPASETHLQYYWTKPTRICACEHRRKAPDWEDSGIELLWYRGSLHTCVIHAHTCIAYAVLFYDFFHSQDDLYLLMALTADRLGEDLMRYYMCVRGRGFVIPNPNPTRHSRSQLLTAPAPPPFFSCQDELGPLAVLVLQAAARHDRDQMLLSIQQACGPKAEDSRQRQQQHGSSGT